MEQKLPAHRAREYETIFIVHPDAGTEVIDRVAGRCREVVGRLSGKLIKAENWGRRRLAYPVRKNSKGIYIYLRYLGYSDMVHEIERNLRMLDPVIKYMTVKIDEDVDPAARPAREEDISFMAQYDEDDRAAPVEAAGAIGSQAAAEPAEARDDAKGETVEAEDSDDSDDDAVEE
jgi:small subunit ribosomal protein S6